MKTIYLHDSYAKEFSAAVISADGKQVVLSDTAFYPTGGGQPHDTGTLECNGETFNVADVSKNGEIIFHHVDREGLKPGDDVRGIINWERRHRLMRMHTAAHIISAVINMQTKALITGNQLGLDKSRIDFSLEHLDKDAIAGYVAEANNIASSGIKIKTYFLPREEAMKLERFTLLSKEWPHDFKDLRIVEIGDIDTQADGGTHVSNTMEIGKIVLKKIENKGKNNRRIEYLLED